MMEVWGLKEAPSQTFQVTASTGSSRSFSTQWHRPSPSLASFDVVLLIIHVFRFLDVTYLRKRKRAHTRERNRERETHREKHRERNTERETRETEGAGEGRLRRERRKKDERWM